MPLIEPKREVVTAAILAGLATIKAGATVGSAGWFYHYTPAKLTRSLLNYDQYKDTLQAGPVYGINRGDDSEVALIDHGSPIAHDLPGKRVFRHALVMDIAVYVLGDLTTPADTKLQRAWGDHFECLTATPTLGGLVHLLEPYGREMTDRGQWEPYAGFVQSWVARFTEQR